MTTNQQNYTLYRIDEYYKNTGTLIGYAMSYNEALEICENTTKVNYVPDLHFSQITTFKSNLNYYEYVNVIAESLLNNRNYQLDTQQYMWENGTIINTEIFKD